MNESVTTPQEKPKAEQSTDKETNEPDKIIIENQPISISIPSNKIKMTEIYRQIMNHELIGIVLGSGENIILDDHFHRTFNDTDFNFLVNQDNVIYVFGIIGYYDIFNIQRLTYFCYRLSYFKGEIGFYESYNKIE